jgi:DNA-binding PadR family transcriptional regulator
MREEHRHGMRDEGWGQRRVRPRRGPGGGRGGGWGFFEAGPGSFGPVFGRHGFGRGPRARRGDVRAAILDLLSEGEPWNGYQLIQEIAERTHGVWRPSAGSVYPALQQLEDEGLISPEEGEGRRRLYRLTDEGRAYVEANADELRSSWDAVAGMADDVALELRDLIRQVAMASVEVARAGSDVQLAEARRVLAETRRSLYRILAADEPESDTSAGAEEA